MQQKGAPRMMTMVVVVVRMMNSDQEEEYEERLWEKKLDEEWRRRCVHGPLSSHHNFDEPTLNLKLGP